MTVPQDLIERVSDDAKSVGYALLNTPGSKCTFHMEVSGPSPRCQAALDELVSNGLAAREVHDARTGAATYRPLVDFSVLGKWSFERLMSGEAEKNSFNLWQPLEALQSSEQSK